MNLKFLGEELEVHTYLRFTAGSPVDGGQFARLKLKRLVQEFVIQENCSRE